LVVRNVFYEHQGVTEQIIASAIKVHRALGPGLLESAYARCLEYELRSRERIVEREMPISLNYEGLMIEHAYRADLVVDGCVLVEVKAIDEILPIHDAQVLTYLRFTQLTVALILNFNCATLRKGIRRLVLKARNE
jgi:GxxExxY protein